MELPSQAVALIVVSCIFPALALTAVGLRFYARHLTAIKPDSADYIIVFTLLNAVLNAIACIIGAVACGIGRPLSALTEWQEILFVTQFFYVFSVWSVKVSVLQFYKSIFKTRTFVRIANVTIWILTAWIIAFFFTTLFQDTPIQRNWGTVGSTINWRDFYIVEIASDLALDIFILCMPLPVISGLSTSRKRKWLIAGVFWLGAIIVIASTVRLYYMVLVLLQFQAEDDDFSFTTVDTIIWGSIEPCMSVVAACLPVLGPILYRKQRVARAARPSYLSSFFQKSSKRPLKGNLSRITDSIDQMEIQDDVGYSTVASTATRPSTYQQSLSGSVGGPSDIHTQQTMEQRFQVHPRYV